MTKYPNRTGATQKAVIDTLRQHGGALNSTTLVAEVWPKIARNRGMNPDVNTVLAAAWRLARRGVVVPVFIEGEDRHTLYNLPLSEREKVLLAAAEDEHPRATTFWVLREVWM